MIAERCGALVIDLGADDDREEFGLCHAFQVHAKLGRDPSSAGLDHPEVGEIVDDTSDIGVEKHDFFSCGEFRVLGERHEGEWQSVSKFPTKHPFVPALRRSFGFARKISFLSFVWIARMSEMSMIVRVSLFLIMGVMSVVAEFVPPAVGPVPFRRDRLPLDIDTINGLAQQVALLASSAESSAAGRRSVAQMAALALALNPDCKEAHDLLDSMKGDSVPNATPPQRLKRMKNHAWQVMSWLSMPAAGDDGQALAACLGDVLVAADPRHPKAKSRKGLGETGAWKSWVADVAAFRTIRPEPEVMSDVPEKDPEPKVPEMKLTPKEFSLAAPLRVSGGTPELDSVMAFTKLDLSVSAPDGAGGFIHPNSASIPTAAIYKRLMAVMKERHPTLPENLKIHVAQAPSMSPKQGLALTAPLALLLDAAITGEKPTATALAVVGDGGKLELPPLFWQSIRAISADASGQRLIVPAKAEEFLKGLIIMGEAEFFLDNEIMFASTAQEMCDLAAGWPRAEIAAGYAKFEEIQTVGKTKTLGSFVAHPSTQQRLKDLLSAMPNHASARMLALQGSRSRPRFLERNILAREIRAALEPASYLALKIGPRELSPQRLEAAHESCREKLDVLVDFIGISDRDLHKDAQEVADSLRTLSRLYPEDTMEAYYLREKQISTVRSAREDYNQVLKDLEIAIGKDD